MLLERIATDGVVFYVSPRLRAAGVKHAFSTRVGGVSAGPFDSLNLGNPGACAVRDDVDHIRQNYRRLAGAAGLDGRQLRRVRQVHGSAVACATVDGPTGDGPDADAIVSDDPRCLLTVRVADCVPILIARDDGQRVAAVHAGWRGVVANVIASAMAEMRKGASGGFVAAIGPCIGMEAFEVGGEVLAEFERIFGKRAPVQHNGNAKGHVDLRAAVRLQLLACGLSEDEIDISDRCTYRDSGEFFSHRRDKGITGRMAAVIAARHVGHAIACRAACGTQ
jgi:YfiH family protein